MTDKKQLEIEKSEESISSEIKSNNEKEFSEFEKKMIPHGWDPEGELSAEDWIDVGFKVKNKKLDSLFSSIEKLKEKLDKQEKDAYARAKADLESKRIEAIEMADVKRVKEIEQQTKNLVEPSVKEHVDAFMTKHHAWMNGTSYRDQEMQLVCRKRDEEMMAERLTPEVHFEKLEKYMMGKYPDYFQIEPEPIANAVEGKQSAAIKSNSKKKLTFDDLDEFQKKAAKNLQKTRNISIEDYIKRLTELGR